MTELALPKPAPAVKHAGLISAISKGFAPEIAAFVRAEISKATKPLIERILHLENELSQRVWRGTWERGTLYLEHNLTTHQGSLFLCRVGTDSEEPGGGACWVLITKRGRDGKDGQDAPSVRTARSHR